MHPCQGITFHRLYAAFTRAAANPNGPLARVRRRFALIRALSAREGATMLDVLLLALGLGAFALMALYAHACARV